MILRDFCRFGRGGRLNAIWIIIITASAVVLLPVTAGAQSKTSEDSGIQSGNRAQTTALVKLKGGGGCRYDKHQHLKCYHFHLAATDTPYVWQIDGKGPEGFGKKGSTFNGGGWNEGFQLALPAGQHSVTLSFNFDGMYSVTPTGYTVARFESPRKRVFFNTEPGHTYTVNEIANNDGTWEPIILDVTSKRAVATSPNPSTP
jgi:hypothetical protein